ncbi:MAG: hypothetical protein ACM3XM_05505 [Mycobacterium leprae]
MVIPHPHPALWHGPLPLWAQGDATIRSRPSLLRFATDEFMAELKGRLGAAQIHLEDLLLRAETYKDPVAWSGLPPQSNGHPKLYQPAHGRFYLVAASLLCDIPGEPDRHIEPGAGERVGFVLRRLVAKSPTEWQEYAWLPGEGWCAVGGKELPDKEERLPLFPMPFQEAGQTRRLYAGLVPTASKESYAAGKAVQSPFDDMAARFEQRVLNLWSDTGADLEGSDATKLLDALALYLGDYLPGVWQAVQGAGETLSAAETAIVAQLRSGSAPLANYLKKPPSYPSTLALEYRTYLQQMKPYISQYAGALPPPPPLPKLGSGELYGIRCVFERPCANNWQGAVLSDLSERFSIAGFFDADAPQRPVQITLPFGIPKEGPKGVAVLASTEMRKQLERFRSIKDLKSFDSAADEPKLSIGMVCSLSIPIITIVAMILLMVMVNVLNFIFWWKPLFKICFPISLKAGEGE